MCPVISLKLENNVCSQLTHTGQSPSQWRIKDFPRRVRQLPGALSYYLAKHFAKTVWKWKKLDQGGETPITPSLDPPLIADVLGGRSSGHFNRILRHWFQMSAPVACRRSSPSRTAGRWTSPDAIPAPSGRYCAHAQSSRCQTRFICATNS